MSDKELDMDNMQKNGEELLNLPDEQYFTLEETFLEQLEDDFAALYVADFDEEFDRNMLAKSPTVQVVKMPDKINIDESESIPVLTGSIRSGQRIWEVDYEQNFWLVIANQQSGDVFFTRPFLWDKRAEIPPPSRTGNEPEKPIAKSKTTFVNNFDLRKMLPTLDWKLGNYFITALDFDWYSNTELFELVSNSSYEAVHSNITEKLNRYTVSKMPHFPERAVMDGIQVTYPKERNTSGKTECSITVDIQSKNCLIKNSDEGSFLLFTLIMVQLDDNWPVNISLAVPVELLINADGEEIVKARFSFDLNTTAGDRILKGQYMTYFMSGRTMSGPFPVNL